MRSNRLVQAFSAALLSLALGVSAQAQIIKDSESPDAPGAGGPQLDRPVVQRYKVGLIIKAVGGPCNNIFATVPAPTNWPEQQTHIVQEDVSSTVERREDRILPGNVRQMVIEVAELPAGQEARCVITYEITRSTLLPPKETAGLTIPKKVGRDILGYLGPSILIESKHNKIVGLAKQLVAEPETDWQKVEAIYEYVRTSVKFVNGPLKGAVHALSDKTGDVEDLTSLFIALCRAAKIPARTVWVVGGCHAEFYLTDPSGKGYWFPCQLAGDRDFGGIRDSRAILQKGDNFRDPDRPRDKMRYVSELVTGAGGGGKPQVKFVRETVGQ